MGVLITAIVISLFSTTLSAPQQPENDQYQITDLVTEHPGVVSPSNYSSPQNQSVQEHVTETYETVQNPVEITKEKVTYQQIAVPEVSFTVKVYKFVAEPLLRAVRAPKVNAVLRNIGTCVVNGAMELFSYYLPAPFMPLIASAAGLVIPFEPVVMLKEKMPVTSYRRAFQTAMSSFLSTFDKYKVEEDYDPYMTRRFNRRFMNDDSVKKGRVTENPDV
ncbi:hypothetical protein B5X24_HaOG210867 [Helicoverpa armigera]|uniref:MICOS complex subunit n=1 Tax=Helicoverpa armigera TaxID=29058 RepID=A0A2W1BLS3_HELAM|nr:hypothetical protein B5X24_HaOG210867 [Helicoverpa armigera]